MIFTISSLQSIGDLSLSRGALPCSVILEERSPGHHPHRALGATLVREVLGAAHTVLHSEGEAPTITGPGPELSLSISRRGPWAVAALGAQSVGIDIEDRTAKDEIPWELLTITEQTWLLELQGRCRWYRFLDLWVAKESVAKAAGMARSVSPQDVTIRWKNAIEFIGTCSFPCRGQVSYESAAEPRWVVALAVKD